jgi:hypothetical protein
MGLRKTGISCAPGDRAGLSVDAIKLFALRDGDLVVVRIPKEDWLAHDLTHLRRISKYVGDFIADSGVTARVLVLGPRCTVETFGTPTMYCGSCGEKVW